MDPTDWLPYDDPQPPVRHAPTGDEATWVEPSPAAYTPAADILASLTFFPCQPAPCARRRHPESGWSIVAPFDVPSVIEPLVWTPILPAGRPIRHRRLSERAVMDPTFGAALGVASRMAWQPVLPATTATPRAQPTTATAIFVTPPPIIAAALGCAELITLACTATDFIAEAVVGSDFTAETLTATDFLDEAVC